MNLILEIATLAILIGCFMIFVVLIFYRRAFKLSIEKIRSDKKLHLMRSDGNPLISPQSHYDWTVGGTFNPAALMTKDGNPHLIFRAIGADGVSRLGYAKSDDGDSFNFNDISTYPIFTLENPRQKCPAEKKPDPVMYPSGGSWGGCEDPRVVQIDDRIYITFSAFDGWDFIRMAVVSIDEDDFMKKRWRWSKPLLLSPEGKINKNWVLFPEKINGKFAILHSLSSDVQVDFVDRLEDLARGVKKIESRFGGGPAKDALWEKQVRGAGPPPIKTDRGWLVLYHATDKLDPDKYKVGAMLLDTADPRKVIARSASPILSPDMWYENDAKAGVVYACGTLVKNDILHVYYGGGDKHVCVAHTPLTSLLDWLEANGSKKSSK